MKKSFLFVFAFLLSVAFFLPGTEPIISVQNDRLNLRQGPGTDHPVLARLPLGLTLSLTEESGEWIGVKGLLNGKDISGYLFRPFVEELPGRESWRPAHIIAEPSARMRVRPDTGSDTIASLPTGSVVVAVESDDPDFYRVSTEAKGSIWTGFVFHTLIRVDAATQPPPAELVRTAVEPKPNTAIVDPPQPEPPAEPEVIPAESPRLVSSLEPQAETEYLRRFSISYFNGFFFSRTNAFRDLYENAQFLPRFEAAYRFGPRVFLTTAFSWISASGSAPLTLRKIDASQTFASIGLGYLLLKKDKLGIGLCAAPAMLFFREQIATQKNTGSGFGFDLGVEFSWRFYPAFSGLLKTGYQFATHEGDSVRTQLGGFWVGLGIQGSL